MNPFAIDERLTLWQAGAYVQATRPLLEALSLTAGLRVDRYGLTEASRLGPRLGAEVALSRGVSLRASYGRYHQQPFPQFVAAFPDNRRLEPFRADHVVAGLSIDRGASTRFTLEVYRKQYAGYPVSSQVPSLSLANIGDTFAVRDVLFPMVNAGSGRATGLELFAERRPSPGTPWSGVANLSIARARYRGLDRVPRPGAFDYPIVANLSGRYQLARGWSASARLAWLAGRPFTPVDVGLSTAQRRAVYDLGRVNAERTPDYFRLDVRLDRQFGAGGRPLVIFGGVQNVTNRKNVAGYTWDRRSNAIRTSEQLGIFPTAGLEWQF